MKLILILIFIGVLSMAFLGWYQNKQRYYRIPEKLSELLTKEWTSQDIANLYSYTLNCEELKRNAICVKIMAIYEMKLEQEKNKPISAKVKQIEDDCVVPLKGMGYRPIKCE